MSDASTLPQTPPNQLAVWLFPMLRHPSVYGFMGIVILALDLLTGPFLMFPILFVIPVTLSAWFCSSRCAFSLALLLPLGRFFIAAFAEHTFPPIFAAANAVIRAAVLGFIAYLVCRTARQTKEQDRQMRLLEGILHICTFCKKIKDERENWKPIEGYIAEHSEAQFSNSMCPECAKRNYGHFFPGR
jgi:hypothetical protein